jgi:hypothetical protein
LVTILFIVVVRDRINPLNLGIIGFLIIPSQITVVKNLFLVLGILGLLVYLKRDHEKIIKIIVLAALTLSTIHLARIMINSDVRINQSFVVSTSMVLSYLTVCVHGIRNIRRELISNSP